MLYIERNRSTTKNHTTWYLQSIYFAYWATFSSYWNKI